MSTDDTSAFARGLRDRIRAALTGEPRSFYEIVRRCLGAYPLLVAEVLRGPEFQRVGYDEILESVGTIDPTSTDSALSKVEGNPALCSWYFTDVTCSRISRLRDWQSKRIAFLGAPRLFEWFVTHSVARDCVLFDVDERMIECLRTANVCSPDQLIVYDVSTVPVWKGCPFDCVFFDPPWYPEAYPLWVARASELAAGGMAAFALFPELTRPSAEVERKQILGAVHGTSAAVTVVSAFLEYEVPTFERAEFEAAGLTDVRPWKVADLVILDDVARCEPPLPEHRIEKWVEVDVADLRIFVGQSRGDDHGFQLLSALPDGTVRLRSPSRRDPGRVAANILSSRGHGAITSRPEELLSVLRQIGDTVSSGGSITHALLIANLDVGSNNLLMQILGDKNG